jgi:hypothetical protein
VACGFLRSSRVRGASGPVAGSDAAGSFLATAVVRIAGRFDFFLGMVSSPAEISEYSPDKV